MDEVSQEYKLLASYEDIFSQYDDNFALECVQNYESNLRNNENDLRNDNNPQLAKTPYTLEQIPNDSKNMTKPKFGKKQITNKESQKGIKKKKFVPPTRNTDEIIPQFSKITDLNKTIAIDPIFDSHSQCLPPTNQLYELNRETECQSKNKEKINTKKKKESVIGGLILGSLNVLIDEDVILTQTQETQSDQSSVKDLMQSRHESFCSVASLNKTYKNLDCKSFEIPNNNHKIYTGDEYLKLFENKTNNETIKRVAMSTIFGDIGFNVKYSEYVKNGGVNNDELVGEERDAYMKILSMYPDDNKCLVNMKINY